MTFPLDLRALVVCVLLVASVGTAAASAAPTAQTPSLSTDTNAQANDGFLAGLQDTLETIDEFLETVVDLVRTINQLTGEGGE